MSTEPMEQPDEEKVQEALAQARNFMIGSDLVAIGQGPQTIADSIALLASTAEVIGDLAMLLRRLGDQPEIVAMVAEALEGISAMVESALPPNVDEQEER